MLKSELMAIADKGCLKIFRLDRFNVSESPSIELFEHFETEAHEKFAQNLSDESGRFAGDNFPNTHSKGYGEPHNIGLERERRAIKQITNRINEIMVSPGVERWFLAVSKEIYPQIRACLLPAVSEKIALSLARDLTKTNEAGLLESFNLHRKIDFARAI
jgi:hypothetical protein